MAGSRWNTAESAIGSFAEYGGIEGQGQSRRLEALPPGCVKRAKQTVE